MQESEIHCAVNSRMQERRSWDSKIGMRNLHRHKGKILLRLSEQGRALGQPLKVRDVENAVGSDSQKGGS